ncbi:MAG: hypothetical protein RJB38_1928 [Pseudomonadota bacterium]
MFFLQIVLAISLAYLPFAGWMSVPWTGDQKVYLSTALEMHQQGSLLIPYLFGEPSYFKPPLQYWSTLLGFQAWGESLWGAFLPSVIAAFVGALAIASVGKRVLRRPDSAETEAAPTRAALWFLGSLGTATFGMAAQMEVYLVSVSFLAWAFALKYLDQSVLERRRRPGFLYLAFVMVGVLAWVKSPLYSVLWTLSYGALLILRREWREFVNLHSVAAVSLGVVIGASWYLTVLALDHDRFIADYWMRETWAKKGGNGGTPKELWLALAGFCFPFVFLSLAGRAWFQKSSARLRSFVIAAGLPAALFFSLYPYRVSTYLYVLVPLVALIAAEVEATRSRVATGVIRLTSMMCVLVVAYLVWLSVRIELASGWWLVAVLGVGVMACAAWIRAVIRPRFAVWAAMILVAWIHLAGVSLGERDLSGLRAFVSDHGSRRMAMLDSGRNIWHEVGLVALAIGRSVDRLSTTDEVLEALDSGHAVLLSDEQAAQVIPEIHERLAEEDDGREVAVVRWQRLETRRQLSLRELFRAKRKLELSRGFQILTLPASRDWILPEGGV